MLSLEKRGEHHKIFEQALASFAIDFELALTAPDDAKARNLAMRF